MRSMLFLLAFWFVTGTLWAQYPEVRPIDPYPFRVVGKESIGSLPPDRWKPVHACTVERISESADHGGSLSIKITGDDPYCVSHNLRDLFGDQAIKPGGPMEMTLRMVIDHDTSVQLFWTAANTPAWSEKQSIRFQAKGDGLPHDYTFRSDADGDLLELRVDPGNEPGTVAILETLTLKRLIIESPEEKAKPRPLIAESMVLEGETRSIRNADGSLRLECQIDGKAAFLFRNNVKIAVMAPLCSVDDFLPIAGVDNAEFAEQPAQRRAPGRYSITLPMAEATDSEIVFLDSAERHKGEPKYALRIGLRDTQLYYTLHASESVHGPIFRPLGTMEQAILPGVEYLEKGEWSSSTADIETSEHLRFAPMSLDVTMPLLAIATDRATFALLYDDPQHTNVVLATPNFIDVDPAGHRMNLFGSEQSGVLRITDAWSDSNRLEEAVLWGVKTRGLPELPKRPRLDEEQRAMNLAGLTKSILCVPGKGWRHAVIPGNDTVFPPSFGADFASTIWQLTGTMPEVPHLGFGGSHLENSTAFFLTGRAEEWKHIMRGRSAHLRSMQKPDGSFEYVGKYLKGHWENVASGHGGFHTLQLWECWHRLGDTQARDAALRGTEALRRFRTPRGAQVWELSLHTPDIMASAWCTLDFLYAYRETGKEEYLDLARRWAASGLPFVYQWQHEDCPVMLYATTPVLGATNWVAPNWIGLPVQWCGLDYAEALLTLAEDDKTFDWRTIAEGILISAEQQQYPEGPSVGLLPDSFRLEGQHRNPADISPVVLERLRRRLHGKLAALDIAATSDGTHRIVAPFPVSLDGTKATIQAIKGVNYQILLDGDIVRTIESVGDDHVDLAP